jgi:hypothetical protein
MTTGSAAHNALGKPLTMRHFRHIQNTKDCVGFTGNFLATISRAADNSRRGQAPDGTAHQRFVARWRGVWREPFRPEWTCDVGETRLTRQRVEWERFTGPCNRKCDSVVSSKGVLHSSRSGVV